MLSITQVPPAQGQSVADLWHPEIQHFDLAAEGFQPIAYSLSQNGAGLLFVGGSEGILEYDGTTWRRLQMAVPSRSTVHALEASEDGDVFYGGQGEFGVIGIDSTGASIPRPWNDLLDEDIPITATFWDISAQRDGVYFLADSLLIRMGNDVPAIWTSDVPFSRMYTADERIFIIRTDGMVFQLVNDELVLVSDFLGVIQDFVTFILPASGEALWMGTQQGDVFRWMPGTPPEPVSIGNQDYFRQHLLEGAEVFPDGSLFLRSWRKGGTWYDATLEENGTFDDVRYAIQLEQINQAFEDADGNTWLATSSGVFLMDRDNPLHVYDRVLPEETVVHSVVIHDGITLFGTDEGIVRLAESSDGSLTFLPHTHLGNPVQDLASSGPFLFAKARNEWYTLQNGTLRPIGFEGGQLRAKVVGQDSLIVAGGSSGVALFSNKSRPKQPELLRVVSSEYSVGEFAIGEDGILWGIISPSGIIRADLVSDSPEVQTWFEAEHYDASIRGVAEFEGEVVFLTSRGMVWPRQVSSRLELGEVEQTYPETFGEPAWITSVSDAVLLVGFNDGAARFDRAGYSTTLIPGSRGLHSFASGTDNHAVSTWGIKHGQPVRAELQHWASAADSWQPQFRSLLVGGKSLPPGADSMHVDLPRGTSSLTVEFGAMRFGEPGGVTFSTRLDPIDPSWSEWTPRAKLDLVRLDPGSYELSIRARDAQAVMSAPLTATFSVRRPWYRSIGAWVMWIAMLVGCGVLGSIRVQRRRIKQFQERAHELEREVTHRTREISDQKEQLEVQAQQLREMDQAKSRFFTNLSHEFRTPLTLISGPVGQVLEGRYGEISNEGKVAFERAESNADRLNRLINQLLDLSRLESGTIKLDCSDHNLSDFARKVTALFTSLGRESRVSLGMTPSKMDVGARYDPDHLEKVLVNLLSNALKFTPEGGSIDVSVLQQDGRALLRVRDTGIGIPKSLRERVFDRFFQVDDSFTRAQEGMGIGLAMSREYARAMGGDIELAVPERGGSMFTVHLPLASEGWLATPVQGNGVPLIQDSEASPDAASSVEAPGPSDQDGPTILIVEDNPDLADFLVELLADDFITHTATDGIEGFEMAVELIPDIVISDVMMPQRDGFELCSMLKQDMRSSHIPVILLTAKSHVDDRIEGFTMGADAYLEKPFNARELHARITALLDVRAQLRKLFSIPLRRGDLAATKEIRFSPRDREFLEQLESVADEYFCRVDFGVDQLADLMHLSRRQLLRKITAITGESPAGLILKHRMGRAVELMSESHASVAVIAEQVGFRSRSHFSKQFAAHFGVAPGEYARQGDAG